VASVLATSTRLLRAYPSGWHQLRRVVIAHLVDRFLRIELCELVERIRSFLVTPLAGHHLVAVDLSLPGLPVDDLPIVEIAVLDFLDAAVVLAEVAEDVGVAGAAAVLVGRPEPEWLSEGGGDDPNA
jgi:hypothetical protein